MTPTGDGSPSAPGWARGDPLDRLAAHHAGTRARYDAAAQLRGLLAAVDRGELAASPPLRLALGAAARALDVQPWHELDLDDDLALDDDR